MKSKHKELCQALELQFGLPFKDNGNSLDSCLQFVGCRPYGRFGIRVKYYWKGLQLLQSEGVMKGLGMNTAGLYCPNIRMSQALSDSRNEGLSRVEITYTITSPEAE